MWQLLVFLTAATLIGCAKPKSSPDERNSNVNVAGKPGTSCEVQFPKVDLCVAWKWEQKPTEETPGSLVFRIYKQDTLDGFPILIDPGKTAFVQLWMPSMGHGSVPVSVETLSVGTYRAQNVFFIMPGAWDIRFQLKDGDQVFDETIVSLSI